MEREVLMALLRSGSEEAWSLAADALARGQCGKSTAAMSPPG